MGADENVLLGGGQPDGRAAVHRQAREQVREIRPAVRQYRRAERRYRKQVMRARGPQQQERAARRLAATPIEDLAKGSGVNVAALRRGSVRTAADVHGRTIAELDDIRDIGPSSASKIKALVSDFARVGPRDLVPPGNPGAWTSADYALVRALEMLALVTGLAPHFAVLLPMLQSARKLGRATAWLIWLFSGQQRKRRVRSRSPLIRPEWSSAEISGSLQAILTGIRRAQQFALEPDAVVASHWRADSSSLVAMLERLLSSGGSAEERSILRRGLMTRFSADLARQIVSTALDTTRLALRLRPYQEIGAKFALAVGRGLLGDDMGLGKTVQALAAIAHATEADDQRHHVVVCPASLIDTWLQEIGRATTGIGGWRFHRQDRQTAFDHWQGKAGILVTSHQQIEHLLSRDHPQIGFVIVDEAHLVKNPDAQRTRAVRSLVGRASRVLLMSGTPMENRAAEFIALADLADPRQGSRLRGQFGDGQNAHQHAAAFRDAVGDLYLRRNQEEVLGELPALIPVDERIEVGENESLACKQALADRNLLGARRALTAGNGGRSAKIRRLAEIITECRDAGRKVIVFSQFREVLHLSHAVIGDDAMDLHGDISLSKRSEVVQRFQDTTGFAAIVMQIELGLGLNLQAASVVIIMEPQLKPSTEQQAIARAHRMGQNRRVVVYRLIAAHSIDERIVELSGFKAALFDQIARQSSLAQATSGMPNVVHDVGEDELLNWGREQYGL